MELWMKLNIYGKYIFITKNVQRISTAEAMTKKTHT